MKKIGIIGVGNMGTHLAQLIYRNKLGPHLLVADKNIYEARTKLIDPEILRPIDQVVRDCDILFLTVKPNNVKEVCFQIRNCEQKKTIVSVAAGVPIERIQSWLGSDHNVVRMMPNIPISINQGSIVWYSENYNQENRSKQNVLNEICQGPASLWVKQEELMDVATVMFGCTPAYIARVFGVYIDMAVELGFSKEEAQKLLVGTFTGTSDLCGKYSAENIIDQVASKGGATEKGLEVLTLNHFDQILREAIRESYLRIQDITHKLD